MCCGRLLASATALLVILAEPAFPPRLFGAETDPGAPLSADIELRKTFRPAPRARRQPSRAPNRGDAGQSQDERADEVRISPLHLEAAAAAIGEPLESSGTLHLPGVGGTGVVLRESTTPVLVTAAGRRVIVDPDRTISRETVAGIARLWPDFSVVQPPAGANLRDLIGSLLDAAGYDTVLRASPLTFGQGIAVRLTPDFVVLRDEGELLEGQMRAISVVNRDEALPAELRELAREHRVRIVELAMDGSAAGSDLTPWRDPAGHVTTMESFRPALLLEEIAVSLGFSVERRVAHPATEGGASVGPGLRISHGGDTALVLEDNDPGRGSFAASPGEAVIALNGPSDLPEAIGALLKRFDIPAIGPTVEFYRTPRPGERPRFVISVPGWLAEAAGRRLLITGAAPPPQVRLYLSREGIDLFEYRIRNGR